MKRSESTRIPVVAVAGNPNSGKTTLFNLLTGLRQKVGNYPGVTVERKEGLFVQGNRSTQLIDLPGIYSLSPQSEEQRAACEVLYGGAPDEPDLDGVIVIADSTSLEKSLYLTLQVLEAGHRTVLILNMEDELAARGGSIDVRLLSTLLNIPVFSISATRGTGLDAVRKALIEWPLEDHSQERARMIPLPILDQAITRRRESKKIAANVTRRAVRPHPWTDRIDRYVLHPFWGAIIFMAVVVVVFQSIFAWAQPLMNGIDALISQLAAGVRALPLPDPLAPFLADGVIAGVGSVLVFLPQILIVFAFLSVLENTGYLSRAALVMDKLMQRGGLQGKSFLPLISSYACAIPGIMATRTIDSTRDRLATIFVAPFMTCSARLPVYALLISAFVPDRAILPGFLGWRAFTLFGLYAVGFVAALLTSLVLKSSILKSDPMPFIIEIPPYRLPQWKSIGLHLWDRARAFLTQAGTVILLVSVVMWALISFPNHGPNHNIEESFAGRFGHVIEPVIKPLGFDWKIGVGLLSAQVAREVMVSTLATIERVQSKESDPAPLRNALQKSMTPLKAFSLMIFFALAMQCTSTLAVVRRETGSWKIPAVMFVYMNILAYLTSLVIYQGGKLLGWG